MEKYSVEKAQNEANEIRGKALDLKLERNENGEPSRNDYAQSEMILQKEREGQEKNDNEKLAKLRESFLDKSENIECPERPEVVKQAFFELQQSLVALGIDKWSLPNIKIKFLETQGKEVLGRVGKVTENEVEIEYDKQFSSKETECLLIEKLKNSDRKIEYPGMVQTLKHELAHVAMWSITGLERQPATKLLDEGWASLVENANDAESENKVKLIVKNGLQNESEFFNRCLDFNKPILDEENLNSAEYSTGRALLIFIKEKFGKDKMIELIQKSPAIERRNNLPSGKFEQAMLNEEIHKTAPEYFNILSELRDGTIDQSDAIKQAIEWEGNQFSTALLDVTEFQNLDELRLEFLNWLDREN